MPAQEAQLIYEEIAPGIRVQQVKETEVEEVFALLVDTARWLSEKGSTQWNALLQGADSHDMKGAAAKGEVFSFRDGDKLSAVVMLVREPGAWDRELWGEDGHDEALYLHRLAVQRDYAGRGLGQAILRWAHSGIHVTGKHKLRLDCIGNHDILNAFYRSAGFTYVGEAPNGFSKYEHPIEV